MLYKFNCHGFLLKPVLILIPAIITSQVILFQCYIFIKKGWECRRSALRRKISISIACCLILFLAVFFFCSGVFFSSFSCLMLYREKKSLNMIYHSTSSELLCSSVLFVFCFFLLFSILNFNLNFLYFFFVYSIFLKRCFLIP